MRPDIAVKWVILKENNRSVIQLGDLLCVDPSEEFTVESNFQQEKISIQHEQENKDHPLCSNRFADTRDGILPEDQEDLHFRTTNGSQID